MFTFIRTIISWSTRALTVCIAMLDLADTLVCDWECIHKTGTVIKRTNVPISRIRTLLHTFGNFMCHAYTYNGVGISYTVAKEVLSVREHFEVLQDQYPEIDIGQLYTVYQKTRCFSRAQDVSFEPLLRRLAKIQCVDVNRLTVQRTYDHPVFGNSHGNMALPELTHDAKITIFDISGILAQVFDIHEDDSLID
jgi:hypothetical protein